MFNLGAPEIILILVVFLVLFGAKKIPELAQGLGKGIREFKKSIKEVEEDINSDPKSSDKKIENNQNKS